jgi:hypothetical protein
LHQENLMWTLKPDKDTRRKENFEHGCKNSQYITRNLNHPHIERITH